MKNYTEYSKDLELKRHSNNHLKETNTSGFIYEDEDIESLNIENEIGGDETATANVSMVTNVAETLTTYVGMGLVAKFAFKKLGGWLVGSAISKAGAAAVAKSSFAVGTTAAAAGAAKVSIFTKALSALGVKSAVAATTTGTTTGLWGAGFWTGIGRSLLMGGKAILSFFTTAAGVTVLAAAAVVWGFFYLRGNPDMYEIKEIWENGKHKKSTSKTKIKNIYKSVAGGLFASKTAGLSFLGKLNDSFKGEGKFTIRISDDQKSLKYVEEYMKGIEKLGESITESSLMNEILAGDSKEDWIDEVFDQYAGFNVSGRKDVDDYISMKAYVSKYMLENDDDEKNPYKMSVAEESEGWYDTFFDNFIPGMNTIGWASWMLSEEYLNQANSTHNITNRKWLHQIMRSYWNNRVDNLDASNFGIQEFQKYCKMILGNDSLLTDIGFLRQLEYGVLNEDGKYTTKGSFEDLLKQVGPFVTKFLKANAASDKKVPVTNVTLAFATFWASYALMASIWEGSITYLALMQLIYGIEDGSKKHDVLKKFSIDDEYESGEKVDQTNNNSKGDVKGSQDYGDISPEIHQKNADIVINKFKELEGLDQFRG